MPATPEAALYAKLAGTAAVNDAVGGRITPQLNTQEPTYPLILYRRVGGVSTPTLSGPGSLGRYLFELAVYAETEAHAAAVVVAVEAALFPAGGWRDVANGVHGVFPDDSAADHTDEPRRQWSRLIGIWFQPT